MSEGARSLTAKRREGTTMEPMRIRIVPFARAYDRSRFSCGHRELDDWIKSYAGQSEKRATTRTSMAVPALRRRAAFPLHDRQESSRCICPRIAVACTYVVRTKEDDVNVESTASERSARLNMRISPEALELIKAAARRQQQDLSAFVLGTAIERARAILIEDQVLRLSPSAVAQLEDALDAAPSASPQLMDLIRSVRKSGQTAPISRDAPHSLAGRGVPSAELEAGLAELRPDDTGWADEQRGY